jgi:hypothetical protein
MDTVISEPPIVLMGERAERGDRMHAQFLGGRATYGLAS